MKQLYNGRRKIKKPLGPQEEQWIRNLSSKQLKGAGNLYCVMNTPYIVNTNEDVASGIAKGTRATLQDIILTDDVVIFITQIGGREVHTVSAKHVVCLVFKHTVTNWQSTTCFPTLPAGCFPILPYTHVFKKLFHGKNGSAKNTLFPCELATILTGHKMQGQTVANIMMGSMSPKHKFVKTGWIYVVLSKVRSIEGLFLLNLLETNIKKYKPSKELENEMKRLSKIQERTMSRLRPIILNMSEVEYQLKS